MTANYNLQKPQTTQLYDLQPIPKIKHKKKHTKNYYSSIAFFKFYLPLYHYTSPRLPSHQHYLLGIKKNHFKIFKY